ncbi:DUF6166 domain-containing protein [Coleofasciculus sp.]|uniref:DUF6166 domain-containing protein n=1 Tax=Coleofasciculus sp. TaxID=3100458 RepID=UPI003A49561C
MTEPMRDKKALQDLGLYQTPVTFQVYQQLQIMWQFGYQTGTLNYPEHTAQQALSFALQLNLVEAAGFMKNHPEDYDYGLYHGRWMLAGEFKGDVIAMRCHASNLGPSALSNVPRTCISGSPDGHEWGYGGSGPNDFALDILNQFLPTNGEDAIKMYRGYSSRAAAGLKRAFCAEFIAIMPREGGQISNQDIVDWIEQQGYSPKRF